MDVVTYIVDAALDRAAQRDDHVAIQLRADITGELRASVVALVESRMAEVERRRVTPEAAIVQLADAVRAQLSRGLTYAGWRSWVDAVRRDMPVVWYVAWEGWRATKMGVDPDPRWVRGFFPIYGPLAPAAWWPHRVTDDPYGEEIETTTKTHPIHLTRVFAELEAVGLTVREMTPARRGESSSWRWLPCEGPMPDLREYGEPFFD